MTVDLPTYIPLTEAVRRYRIRRAELTRLVEAGRIRAAKVNGGVAVAEDDVKRVTTRDELWDRVRHLDGHPISMTAACQKYKELNFASLSRWVSRGYIRVVEETEGRGRGRKRLLNEADVAYASHLLRMRGKKPGKRLFTPENLPPHLIATGT